MDGTQSFFELSLRFQLAAESQMLDVQILLMQPEMADYQAAVAECRIFFCSHQRELVSFTEAIA